MSFVKALVNIAQGAAAGVAVVVDLLVAGPVGTATAIGMAIGSMIGGEAGLADTLKGDSKK